MIVYLDASFIIYLIEAAMPLHAAALARLQEFQRTQQLSLMTSRLSWIECRVKPLREKNERLLGDYARAFDTSLFVADIDSDVIDRAANLRAGLNLKTPDAIHIATAINYRAELLLTGDADFRKCTDVRVELITEPKRP